MARLHYLGIWYRAARPYSLTASVVPVSVGTALAAQTEAVNPLLFVLALLGSVLIQAGTNLTDEYSDHVKGSGGLKFPAPHKVIQQKYLSPRAVLLGAYLCFGVASLMGLYIVTVVGWPILVAGILSLLAAYFHSAGPAPLGSIGLGEVTVFLFMGPLIVLAAYYVQAGQPSAEAFWNSLPVGFLVAAILLANNIRDMEEDRAAGKATIATLWGRRFASRVFCALVFGSFLAISSTVILGLAPVTLLAPFLFLPRAFSLARFISRASDRRSLHQALKDTASLHLGFGLLMVAGLIATRIWGLG